MMPTTPMAHARNWAGRLAERYSTWSTPTLLDLPNWRVLVAFPALLVVLGAILIGAGINGTSSGQLYEAAYTGDDPALIVGEPQAIRSDEWNVGTVWSIAQAQQGFPARNETFPGGMDAALPYDLPRAELSIIFRPHQAGYLFLDVDHATAWRWWIPGLLVVALCYLFAVTVLPRRPIMAMLVAVGFFYSPFLQWWYQSTTLWPIAWAFATMTALVWAMRSKSWLGRIVWAFAVGYLTVVMAMGIYVPFIIPVVLVVLFFGIGILVAQLRSGDGIGPTLRSLLPVLGAGVAAAAVTGIWLNSKSATVAEFLSTVYPGQRLTAAGSGGALIATRTIASSFAESLQNANGFLGTNSSEASTFFLVGAFLIPVAGWAIYRQARTRATLPWVLIGLVAACAVLVAFVLIPGWDPIARLLLLDRTTPDRLRIGLGVASIALLVFTMRYLDTAIVRSPRVLSGATAGVFALSQLAVAAAIVLVMGWGQLWSATPLWALWTLVSAASLYLFARRRATWAAVAFFVVTVASGAFVNPAYVGVLDLRDSETGKFIIATDEQSSGTWVGIGDPVVTATVIESGVEAFNGTQGAPSVTMWNEIDPQDRYENVWNRIGGINWIAKPGEPVLSNPAPDQILITFDACSDFAQDHVDYVVTNNPINTTCLTELSKSAIPSGSIVVYEVKSAGS